MVQHVIRFCVCVVRLYVLASTESLRKSYQVCHNTGNLGILFVSLKDMTMEG